MDAIAQWKQWMAHHCAEVRKDYFHFLRFKSISADPKFAAEMARCAEWLTVYIGQKTGMQTECIKTEGYPLVYAEDLRAGPAAPTVLIYGHYDVQPVDPLELWHNDPFEPTERDGKIYARGAVDDKGQIFYAITALRAWHELGRAFPMNLKLCVEGEEESSSLGLSKSLPQLKKKLRADELLVIDFDQFDEVTPALVLGARGIAAFEVTLTGSKSDLHSGIHGGMAYNPNKALVQLLAQLWDEQGRVAVKGFYDDVSESTEEERARFAFHYTKESYSKEFEVGTIGGEKGRTLAENNTLRPTLEINGIGGGYTGPGFKTVIPAQATAKISCRLVPHQDPEKVSRQIADFLKQRVVHGMQIKVHFLGGEPAFRSSPDTPLAKAVTRASAEVMGKPCKNILCAASIPIVAKMIRELGVQVVGMGYGLPTDDIHAPNEHFSWHRFEKGFLTVARILELR